MEFKGTKGEWEYSYQPVVSNGLYIQTVDKTHKNTFIGEVGGGLQSATEIESNAKLIASAPDLLEALKHGLRLAKTLPNKESIAVKQFVKNATKAIEKALK